MPCVICDDHPAYPFPFAQGLEISKTLDWSLNIQYLEPGYGSIFLPHACPGTVEVLGISFYNFPLNLYGVIYTASPLICTWSLKTAFRNCIFPQWLHDCLFPKAKVTCSFPQLLSSQLPENSVASIGIHLKYSMNICLVSPQNQPRPRIPSEGRSHPIYLFMIIATNNVWCMSGCVMKDA